MRGEPGEDGAPDKRAARVAARQAEILGSQPRILPMTPDEYTEELLALNAAINTAAGAEPDLENMDWLATVMRHPRLIHAHAALALVLMAGGALPARDRELAILRTAWLVQAPFEWSGHVDLGKRLAGLTSAEIERVTHGAAAPGWSAHDAAVLRAVEEMIGDAMISDETWAVLAQSYEEPQFLELPILIGQYLGVAFLQNALRTRIADRYGGLTDR